MYSQGALTEAEVRWFIPKIAEGIQYLNSKGLGHCDLKPANILLAADMTPKLADLGLSEKLGPGDKKLG
jgi:serine/threonine protein kinase